PFYAVHLSSVTQQRLLLNVFVAKVRTEKASQQRRHDGMVYVPKMEVWKLVDWTDPMHPEMCQQFEAKGETDGQAIRQLIKGWDTYHNRYPEGEIMYQLRIGDTILFDSFETNGRTRWDIFSELLGYVATAALGVVGVAALIVAVPAGFIASSAV